MRNKLFHGDSAEVLKTFPDESIDCTATDPPYGLGSRQPTGEEIDSYLKEGSTLDTKGDFMGKEWQIPHVPLWREVYRVMKPGAILASFAGSRTLDIMAAGIQAAGFTYVGTCGWVYSSGFPKSLNIGKAIEKTGHKADHWKAYGTALKPAWEPILLFSKGPTDWTVPFPPFFYTAKASRSERSLEGEVDNDHVTVKPLRIMTWIVGIISKPGDLVLDCFLGSGTTAVSCLESGRSYVGIEKDVHSFEIASKRIGVVKGRLDEDRGERDMFDYAMSLGED